MGMREIKLSVWLEIGGVAFMSIAGLMVWVPLGLLVAGLAMVLFGVALERGGD